MQEPEGANGGIGPLLRTVNTVEPYPFRVLVVQNFYGVTVVTTTRTTAQPSASGTKITNPATANRKHTPTSVRRVVMMTPPCHSACACPFREKNIGKWCLAKDQKEVLRKGDVLGAILHGSNLPHVGDRNCARLHSALGYRAPAEFERTVAPPDTCGAATQLVEVRYCLGRYIRLSVLCGFYAIRVHIHR